MTLCASRLLPCPKGAGSTQPSSGSPLLRLSWLPPGLTSLELANCPLGCPEAEDPQPAGSQQHGGAAAGTAGGRARQSSCFGLVSLAAPALGSEKGGKRAGKRRNSSAMVGASSGFPSDPVAAAAADPEPGAQDCGCCPGAARGHQRLAALERLCLNGCAYGCSGHLQVGARANRGRYALPVERASVLELTCLKCQSHSSGPAPSPRSSTVGAGRPAAPGAPRAGHRARPHHAAPAGGPAAAHPPHVAVRVRHGRRGGRGRLTPTACAGTFWP